MATKEDKELLRLLVGHVSRAFYESKHIVILDQLCHVDVLKDEELGGRVGVQLKELQKLVYKLVADKLVKVYRRNEITREGQRPVNKQYYYLDYKSFCDVVKWRIYNMRNDIDQKLRDELGQQGYVCPRCRKSFQTLDVAHLTLSPQYLFLCDNCETELVEHENTASVQGNKDRMQRFIAQTKWIVEDLQKTDKIKVPRMDAEKWLEDRLAAARALNGDDLGDGIMIAGDGGSTSRPQRVQIELSGGQDDEEKKRREEDAEAMRQQNALPEWHTHSTVTGAVTSLGLASTSAAMASQAAHMKADNAELKPDLYATDLDRYYASLDSAAQPAPADGEEEEEEEDDFEEIEYGHAAAPAPSAAPMNMNGKRAREEDGGTAANGRSPKVARTHGATAAGNAVIALPIAPAADEEEDDDFEEVDVS